MPDTELQATYRILDASANRAAEGLRSLEEFARFVLNDGGVSAKLKSARHELAAAMDHFPRSKLLAARDTEGDVGTEIAEPREWVRHNLSDVLAAATSRTAQSLRVLEEYGKTIDAQMAVRVEQLRYRCYTLFASLELAAPIARRQNRLRQSRLYVLIDAGADEASFADFVRLLFDHGVDVIQLRDRRQNDRVLISRAKVGTQIAREREGLFIVNDRADLAVAADADGVHVGQDELPAPVARQIVGPDRLVGVSTHNIDQALQAAREGADYIGCGPVFAGRTKTFDHYVGTEYLRVVADRMEIPAFAIGGIDADNVSGVIAAGIDRIAVTGAVRDAEDPAAAATRLKELLVSAPSALTIPDYSRLS